MNRSTAAPVLLGVRRSIVVLLLAAGLLGAAACGSSGASTPSNQPQNPAPGPAATEVPVGGGNYGGNGY